MVNLAVKYFLGKDGLERKNCAQAVLCGFKDVLNISEEVIESYHKFGKGHAPENTCGAVFAAEYILESADKSAHINVLKEHFEENAGSFKCKEIRVAKKMSCVACVENSTRLVSDIIFGESASEESSSAV